jgi:hypothetical protein
MSLKTQLEVELQRAQEGLYSLPPIDDPQVSIRKDFYSLKIGQLRREIDKLNVSPQT